MKNNITKEELQFTIDSIKEACQYLQVKNGDSWDRGFNACCSIILKKIIKMENREYLNFVTELKLEKDFQRTLFNDFYDKD